MRKIFLLCLLISCCQFHVKAQSIIKYAEYNKTIQSAVVNEFPYNEGTTADGIAAKMKSLGYSGKSTKGYDVYKMVKMPELGEGSYDLYFNTDRKSKKEKDKSVVTLLISKGYDNFITDSTGAETLANGQKLLNNFLPIIAAYDLDKQISAQEDLVKKAEKKYNSSVDDGVSLEKKRRNIEDDIEQNKKDQAKKKDEVNAQQQVLETLRSKRVK